MKIHTIYVIAAQHGTETFGLKILAQLRELQNAQIVTFVAHPEAIAKKRLYIETDLNRSYELEAHSSKEADLARQIIADIERVGPDLILDLHSARSKVGKVGIIATEQPELMEITQALGMDQVAVMPPEIHRASLIGQYSAYSISLEFGVGLRSDKLAKMTAAKIVELLGSDFTGLSESPLPVYLVQRTIRKADVVGAKLINYEFNAVVGGYPFLAAKNAYSEHAGFLAQRRGSSVKSA
jgi:succinylglutamate desuccinylase